MNGKQIADALEKSKLPWGKGNLVNAKGNFCVLGQAVIGANIATKKELEALVWEDEDFGYEGPLSGGHYSNDETTDYELTRLYELNDTSSSKKSLIAKLRSSTWSEREFPIAAFLKHVKGVVAKLRKGHYYDPR